MGREKQALLTDLVRGFSYCAGGKWGREGGERERDRERVECKFWVCLLAGVGP